MKNLKFGYHEVIHPVDTAKLFGTKESFSFGVSNGNLTKQSESMRVTDDKDAISQFLTALNELKTGRQRYLCFEVFTDEANHQIFRVNVCHMNSDLVLERGSI